jgi:hypothetical protein
MHRTRITTAVLLATATACAVALTANAASKGSAPPCTPKITTIKGHRAGLNCGPATATLRLGGKSYTFRNGFCEQSKAAATALQLTLGTTVLGDHSGNAGQPGFDITIGKNRAASVAYAYYGGRNLLKDNLDLINFSGSVPSHGTFTSLATAGTKFTGSWNCHGVVWQAP